MDGKIIQATSNGGIIDKTIVRTLIGNAETRRRELRRYIRILAYQQVAIAESDCDRLEHYIEIGSAIIETLRSFERSYAGWNAEYTPQPNPLNNALIALNDEIGRLINMAVSLQRRNNELLRLSMAAKNRELGALAIPKRGRTVYANANNATLIDTHA